MLHSHPRNYFFKTGIGKTKRKFGRYFDVNWEANYIRDDVSRMYARYYIRGVSGPNGFLDRVFTTENPLFRLQGVRLAQQMRGQEFIPNGSDIARVPFRPVAGISSGGDSSFTAEMFCLALEERRKHGYIFETDQILFVSFSGSDLNKEDTLGGRRFVRYLKQKYPQLPIVLLKSHISTRDYRKLIASMRGMVPKREHTDNVLVALDFYKASLMNQIAEAYNFLNADTANLTEEAMGEITDGTGGFGNISFTRVPKSILLKMMDVLAIPEDLGRNALDTCTGVHKTEQYLSGRKPKFVSDLKFFEILDYVILLVFLGKSPKDIQKSTGHSMQFVQNVYRRCQLSFLREKIGGHIFQERWEDGFKKERSGFFRDVYQKKLLLRSFSL